MPLPVRLMVWVEAVLPNALSVNVNVPVALPPVVGVKVARTMQ